MCITHSSETGPEYHARPNKFALWLKQLRAPFFTASIVPVLVGSCAGFAAVGAFNPTLFSLALVSMICLHAGANMANDYFDYKSGNDQANKNYNPFSGGSRLIQQGLIAPTSVLIASFLAFILAVLTGLLILAITKSLFILILGITGLLGGYFYTAEPIKLGYRGLGEIIIAFLFGILPVYGSYYLQTNRLGLFPLAPALIVAMLIFLVILINEFPDQAADRHVNKKTLVVLTGPRTAMIIYICILAAAYAVAITSAFIQSAIRWSMLLFLLTFPLAAAAIRFLKEDALNPPGKLRPNKFTIILHLVAGLLISAALIAQKLVH